MSKRIIIISILLLISLNSFSQILDGYKYIYVQTMTYQNGTVDIWGISSKLRASFAKKGLIVLTENSLPPNDLAENSCILLNCFINHTNIVYGTNEVTITILNCKNQIIHTNTGSAKGFNVQDDFNKATKRAFAEIDKISYNFNPSETPKIEVPMVEKTTENEESIKAYLSMNKLDRIEGIYKSIQSDEISYYKIGIIKQGDKFKAIILNSDQKLWKEGEVKAVIEKSSVKDLYSVTWKMGNKENFETFGIMENSGLLSIEFKNPTDGKKSKTKFIKLFPTISDSFSNKKETSKSSGSGFFLTTKGILATNAHVIEGSNAIEVTNSNETGTYSYRAKVLLIDSKNDVALLQINDSTFKELNEIPYTIVENSDIGSKVFTIGFPLNDVMGTNYKVTDGIISSNSGIADDLRYYQISVPLQPGNSGGPLFNNEGNIIGITSARLNENAIGSQIQNVNYAIKSSYLLNLYNMLPNSVKLPSNSLMKTNELNEQVKVLKSYVCLISTF